MICRNGESFSQLAISDAEAVAGPDRGPQLLRLLVQLARFGIDPMAPALLVPRCAVRT